MPDLSMCDDKECPKRKECYRYMAIPNEYRQSYFADSPRKGDGCDEFIKIRPGHRVKDEDKKND